MPCKPNIHPANSIRHAYSRYDTSAPIYWRWLIISANTIGAVNVHIVGETCKIYFILNKRTGGIFDPRRLFVETMPIYKAVATGNRNNEFYRDKLQITLDRHNARQNLTYCVLPHPPGRHDFQWDHSHRQAWYSVKPFSQTGMIYSKTVLRDRHDFQYDPFSRTGTK